MLLLPTVLPLTPTGLQLVTVHQNASTVTMMLSWIYPQGNNLQAIAEHYIISIWPPPLSHPIATVVFTSPWNVTLESSVEVYTKASIVAVNCNGQSDPLLFNITSKSTMHKL